MYRCLEQRLSHVSRKWWLTWIGPEVPHFNSNGDQYIVDLLFVIIISSSIYFVILRYAGYLSNPHNSKDNKQEYVYMRKKIHKTLVFDAYLNQITFLIYLTWCLTFLVILFHEIVIGSLFHRFPWVIVLPHVNI